MVDPDLREAALMMRRTTMQFTPMSDDKLALRRQLIGSLPPQPLRDTPVEERTIPVGGGHPDVTIFIINAKPGTRRPGILHMHGGGFTASSARSSLPGQQDLSEALDCAIVSVEYRLAPETTFAGSLEDNYAGLLWLHANAAQLGVDPARVAVAGESAGGGHAALLAITARDRGEAPVAFQALTYPMIDDRTGSRGEIPRHIGVFGWNADNNRYGWRAFLGMKPGGDDVPAHAVPSRREDLAGLPPAFIGTGGLDLFLHENIAYAQRLMDAGVPTELYVAPGAQHGFDLTCKTAPVSQRFIAMRTDAIRRALAG